MESLSDDLLSELECPVCMEYMLPPISMCGNGHNICNSCKAKLHNCPTCRNKFVNINNRTLENIAKKLKFPCKYRTNGCKDTFPLDVITQHQEECSHGLYKCPFHITSMECSWEGQISDIKDHIRTEHDEPGDSRDVIGLHNARLPAFETSSAWCQVLFTLDELFFRYSKVINDILYCCVLYIGPKSKASKYYYTLTLNTINEKQNVSVSYQTISYETNVEEIFKKGNCPVFHCEFAKNCMNAEKELVMEEEIHFALP